MSSPELFDKAVDAFHRGELTKALLFCQRALTVFPKESEGWRLLALIQRARGLMPEALAAMGQALHLNPQAPLVYTEMANLLSEMGIHQRAQEFYQHALKLDPSYWPAWLNLGNLLAKILDFAQAYQCYLRVLQRESFQFEAILGAIECLRRLRQYSQAESLLKPLLQAQPWTAMQRARLYTQYGVLLHDQGRMEATLEMHQQALKLAPELADAWFNQGSVLQEIGQRLEARASYQHALACNPYLPEARLNVALLDLSEARWQEGFEGLTWRHACQDGSLFQTEKRWQGEPLEAKRVLVHGEHGQGDMLLFARFLRPLLQKTTHVSIHLPTALQALIAESTGLQSYQTPPSTCAYDYVLSWLDLPRAVCLSPEDCPPPYLSAPPLEPPQKQLLRAQWKIGFCWHGQQPEKHILPASQRMAARKAIPLDFFYRLALAFEEHCRFFSLQWPPELPPSVQPLLTDLAPHIRDWRDTAQWVQALDLIISADTAVAHLAGALGKPVWILLPHPSYWIWPATGNTFAWYPQARLFRQSQTGDWESVWPEVQQALSFYLHIGKPRFEGSYNNNTYATVTYDADFTKPIS